MSHDYPDSSGPSPYFMSMTSWWPRYVIFYSLDSSAEVEA